MFADYGKINVRQALTKPINKPVQTLVHKADSPVVKKNIIKASTKPVGIKTGKHDGKPKNGSNPHKTNKGKTLDGFGMSFSAGHTYSKPTVPASRQTGTKTTIKPIPSFHRGK